MKLALSSERTARVAKVRDTISAQIETIASLRAKLAEVQIQAEESTALVERKRQAASPTDTAAVREIAEASVRADLWRVEIGKVEARIEIELGKLRALCAEAATLWKEIILAVVAAVEAEVLQFHRRHFQSAKDIAFLSSQAKSVESLKKLLVVGWNLETRDVEKEVIGCVRALSQLLGEQGGVNPFLFDGTEEFSIAETR